MKTFRVWLAERIDPITYQDDGIPEEIYKQKEALESQINAVKQKLSKLPGVHVSPQGEITGASVDASGAIQYRKLDDQLQQLKQQYSQFIRANFM